MTGSSYAWWQERLASEFFGADQVDRPVIFFVDEVEAERLREGDEVPSLTSAVSSVLMWHGPAFGSIADQMDSWEAQGALGIPPILPLLAVTVLAATAMRSDVVARSHAYYLRLVEQLDIPVGVSQSVAINRIKTAYMRYVPIWWKRLASWLADQGGRFGWCTARKIETRGYIGYAQSQALLRISDHAVLTQFFWASGVQEGVRREAATLIEDLRAWSTRRAGFSLRFREALKARDNDEARLLEMLVADLVDSWDGQVAAVRRDGLQQLDLRVAAREDMWDGWTVGWRAPAIATVAEDRLRFASGAIQVGSEEGATTYRIDGDLPDPGADFSAKGAKLYAQRPRRDILAMQFDADAGVWVEASEIAVFEPYCFLVNADSMREYGRLADFARERRYHPQPTDTPGWQMSYPLTFDDPGSLEVLLSALELDGLVPARRGFRLINGLPVKRGLGRRHYAVGGEPDIAFDRAAALGTEIRVDGSPLEGSTGRPIPLRGLGLKVGDHDLAAGMRTLSFSLHAITAVPQPSEVVNEELPPPDGTVVVPASAGSRFLKDDGSFEWPRLYSVPIPGWWDRKAPELSSKAGFCIPVPADAVWMARVWPDETIEIVLLREAPPQITRLSETALKFWERLLFVSVDGRREERLWNDYRNAFLNHRRTAV